MSIDQRRIRALGRLIGRCALQLPLDSAREVCGNIVVTGTALPSWYEVLPRDVIGAELLRLLREGLPHLERSAATFNRLRAEEVQAAERANAEKLRASAAGGGGGGVPRREPIWDLSPLRSWACGRAVLLEFAFKLIATE